jgi:hypothetical protein
MLLQNISVPSARKKANIAAETALMFVVSAVSFTQLLIIPAKSVRKPAMVNLNALTNVNSVQKVMLLLSISAEYARKKVFTVPRIVQTGVTYVTNCMLYQSIDVNYAESQVMQTQTVLVTK